MPTTAKQIEVSLPPSSPDYRLELPAQDDIPLIWWDCVRFVKKATDRSGGKYVQEDILNACVIGTMQLWVIKKEDTICCVGVTEINKHPGGLELNIVLIGGRDGVHWKHFIADIEAWGRKQGCKWVVATGRRGLTRLLGSGWRETRREFEKDLRNEI